MLVFGLKCDDKQFTLHFCKLNGAESFWKSRQSLSYSRISQNFTEPKVNYRVHKSPPLARILSSTYHPTLISILILFFHLCLHLPSGLFPSSFHTKTLYALIYPPMRAICPTHLIHLDFIIVIICSEDYKL
jgi:hypothetical protein